MRVTFRSLGVQSISAIDVNNGLITGSANTTATRVDPPEVELRVPSPQATVSGVLTLSANWSVHPATALDRVDFVVDATVVGSSTASPAVVQWNSIGVADGPHSAFAQAVDSAGNVSTSSSHSVSVRNGTAANSHAGGCSARSGSVSHLADLAALLIAAHLISAARPQKKRRSNVGQG